MKFRKLSEIMLCLHPVEHHQKDRVSFEIKATGRAGQFRRGHWKGWVEGGLTGVLRECINREEVRASIVTEGEMGWGRGHEKCPHHPLHWYCSLAHIGFSTHINLRKEERKGKGDRGQGFGVEHCI